MSRLPDTSANRFFCLEPAIPFFLESFADFYYAGCGQSLEPGQVHIIEIFLDWEIQLEPYFLVTHTPTGHCWLTWDKAIEDVDFVKRVILAGTQLQLIKSWEAEFQCKP